jgi:molecular chaperone HscA
VIQDLSLQCMAKIGINLSTGSLQKEEVIVGIDLGTTNSLVAMIHPETKKPFVLKDIDNLGLVPSIIHFSEQEISVGHEARVFLETDPTNTIFSIKRLMGKSYKDIYQDKNYFGYEIIDDNSESLVKIRVDDQFYSPIELSSLILKKLKERAEHACKTPVNKAVITVPAYFNDSQRQATRDAGKLAGLDVLRIINEPTAASLAYGIGLDKEKKCTVAVYDLGGGTFDVSILRIEDGIFEVLATNGDTYLGGDDFDKALIKILMTKLNLSETNIINDKSSMQQLRLLAENTKQQLSKSEEVSCNFQDENATISRLEFESATNYLLEKTLQCCHNAIKDSGIMIAEIDEVLLVGGSTRMPMIKNALQLFFNKTPNGSINPDEAVALGAAIQADVLAGNNKEILLLDVTPLSLGVETMGGLMDVLLPRNSKIPFGAGREYTTSIDGQSKMKISVYQGERDLVEDNRKLAEFELENIPSMPAGLPKVSIMFKLNADGILKVEAKELRSGVATEVTIHPQFGLTDEEVEERLMASLLNAKTDIAARALREAQTEAQQLITATEAFLKKHNTFIEPNEIEATNLSIVFLKQLALGDDKNAIQKAIADLNAISEPYAERVMDIAVGQALKGKSL